MTTDTVAFHARMLGTARFVGPALLVVGGYALFYRFATGRDLFWLAIGLFLFWAGGCYVWAVLHRRQPVIAVTDDRLQFGSAFPLRAHGEIRFEEIESARREGNHLLVIRRDGKKLSVGMKDLTRGEQEEVVALVSQRARVFGLRS